MDNNLENINNDTTGINISLNGREFGKLNTEVQSMLINSIDKREQRQNGFIGKIFSSSKDVISIYAAFILCIIGFIICAFIKDGEYIREGMSFATLCVGYMFGVNSK